MGEHKRNPNALDKARRPGRSSDDLATLGDVFKFIKLHEIELIADLKQKLLAVGIDLDAPVAAAAPQPVQVPLSGVPCA